MNIKVDIKDDVLTRKLKKLSNVFDDKIVRNANRAGLRVIQKIAKSKVPVKSGGLRASIGIEQDKRTFGTSVLGARRSRRFKGRAAHLVEFGTKQRTTKSGKNKGRVAPRPFLFPAASQGMPKALERVKKSLERQVIKNS